MESYAGQPLYITVRGITGCGEVLESTSNGFVIDSSSPSLGIVGTGSQAIERSQAAGEINGNVPISHQEYQTTPTFSAIWDVEDEESGVMGNTLFKVGTYPGGGDIESETTVVENYIRSSIGYDGGVPTYITVTAENEAGLVTTVTSEPIVLDTTPPMVGEVSKPCSLTVLPALFVCSKWFSNTCMHVFVICS